MHFTYQKFNVVDTELSGQFDSLIVPPYVLPGTIDAITGILGKMGINNAFMKICRSVQRGESVMIIETRQMIGEELRE